ncbi:hypothetical protein CR513_22885, partial [Mucuna pruriens]
MRTRGLLLECLQAMNERSSQRQIMSLYEISLMKDNTNSFTTFCMLCPIILTLNCIINQTKLFSNPKSFRGIGKKYLNGIHNYSTFKM